LNSGNVGIGTIPSVNFHAKNASGNLEIRFDSDSSRNIVFADNNGTYDAQIEAQANGTLYIATRQAQPMLFAINNSEKMRIDSSGNLLVGTTSTTLTGNAGFTYQGGITTTSNNGSLSAIMNRNTNDGEIVQFRKDNTTVGSIGTTASDLCLTSNNVGFRMDGSNNHIIPVNDSLTTRDAAIDLGYSGGRFKDLYLSGGVYLGGTGSANLLDSYEEGSFVPTLTGEGACSITLSTALGQYNKVGRIVNVTMFFQVSAVSGGSSSLAVNIGNLPFTTNTNLNTTGSVRATQLTGTASALQVSIYNNSTAGRIEEWTGSNATNLSDHIASNSNFAVSVTYSIT